MFLNDTQKASEKIALRKGMKYDKLKQTQQNMAMRFLDMQSVVNAKLAGSQQSVNNAENYPSTWSTNPDGGANGQV